MKKYYRITLADGVMHYMNCIAINGREMRRIFERDYQTLPKVKNVQCLGVLPE
jgi:hypothetical protein